MSYERKDFTLSSDPTLLQIDTIHGFLKRSHWAANRTRETVIKSIENSLCFGIYYKNNQVAFSRVITDYCTFAYLCDVFVDEEFRGNGLSKWMMEEIMNHPKLKSLRRFILATKDAHSLYSRFGFQPLNPDESSRIMSIQNDAV